MQLFNRRKRKKRRNKSDESESSLNLISKGPPQLVDSRKIDSQVRSSPSKRHLNPDGSSFPQLHALLEKVADSPRAGSSSSDTSKKFYKPRKFKRKQLTEKKVAVVPVGNNDTSRSDPSRTSNDRRESELPLEKGSLKLDITTTDQQKVTKQVKDSKRSLETVESSGGKLQNILERLVVHQDEIVSSSKGEERQGQQDSHSPHKSRNYHNSSSETSKTPQHQMPAASTSRTNNANFLSFEASPKDTPVKPRFEMINDENEQSKIFLRKRTQQGKKSKRRSSSSINRNANTPNKNKAAEQSQMLKNCGMLQPQQMEVSPGSTVSMSSCSFDSVLDDPERLERYKQLNQPPPSPPPRRRARNGYRDSDSSWANGVRVSLEQTMRIFGCGV